MKSFFSDEKFLQFSGLIISHMMSEPRLIAATSKVRRFLQCEQDGHHGLGGVSRRSSTV
jgi:hypothetical protein